MNFHRWYGTLLLILPLPLLLFLLKSPLILILCTDSGSLYVNTWRLRMYKSHELNGEFLGPITLK